MNDHKFEIIILSNNQRYLEECKFYLERLEVPEGYELSLSVVSGAVSMTSGYQSAMGESDARYKIYIHQDTFLINPGILADLLRTFESDERIGLIGMVGYEKFSETQVMWKSHSRVGAVPMYGACRAYADRDFTDFEDTEFEIRDVAVVDGFFMATSKDLDWDSVNFDGWDFYDADQCMEFHQRGYRVVVPVQKVPWCLHDDGGYQTLWNYEKYRRRFIKKYSVLPQNVETDPAPVGFQLATDRMLDANMAYREENLQYLQRMRGIFDGACRAREVDQLSEIGEILKKPHFILSGESGRMVKMVGTFLFLGECSDYATLAEDYQDAELLLRRFEMCGDWDTINETAEKIAKLGVTPVAILSILKNEYYENRTLLCERLCGSLEGKISDADRLELTEQLTEEYPSDRMYLMLASICMAYEEYKAALKYLKKMENPAPEILEMIEMMEQL